MKKIQKLFTLTILIVLLVPSAGMVFWPTTETAEKKELQSWPSFMEDGEWNQNVLSDAGAWFEDHFAFREALITANSRLNTGVFRTSPLDKVIYGKDGWLFFNETLDDYLSTNLLSPREINNIAHNCSLMSSYAKSQESQFVLVIVPNKNTIYADKMPDYLQAGQEKNRINLEKALEAENVLYVDLTEDLISASKEKEVYYQRDTHWNTDGALAGYNSLMRSLGLEPETFDPVAGEAVEHSSDLDAMLFPKDQHSEKELVWPDHSWKYVTETADNMDEFIQTDNKEGKGSLLMYRDSFAEALVPLLSESFADAWYSRLLPYNLFQIGQYHPEFTLVERAERRLSSLQEVAIQPLPTVHLEVSSSRESDTALEVKEDGDWNLISGRIPESLLTDTAQIYLSVSDENGENEKIYSLFQTSGEDHAGNGFAGYLMQSSRPEGNCRMRVLIEDDGGTECVYNEIINWRGKN